MMIWVALALQASPLLEDRAFLAAHAAWVACSDRVVDSEFGSSHSADSIARSALAGCRNEETEVRRAVIAFSGEAQGGHEMEVLRNASREGLTERVNERRRRMAAYVAAAQTWVQCTRNRLDAAPNAQEPEQVLIDAALAGCTRDEAAARAAAARAFGGEAAADRLMAEGREIGLNAMRNHLRSRRR
jgi:hypothetical protein